MLNSEERTKEEEREWVIGQLKDCAVIGFGAALGAIPFGPIGAAFYGGAFAASKIFGWDGGEVWHK